MKVIFVLFVGLLVPFVGRANEIPLSDDDVTQVVEKIFRVMKPALSVLTRGLRYERTSNSRGIDSFGFGISAFNGLVFEVTGRVGRGSEDGLNRDGLTVMLCHEIGHLAGGKPSRYFLYSDEMTFSNEGQADYFASSVCLPAIFADEDNLPFMDDFWRDKSIQNICKRERNDFDRARCARIALAVLNASRWLHRSWDARYMEKQAGPVPSLSGRDETIVQKTNSDHPIPQCRLDTFLLGLSCRVTDGTLTYISNPKAKTLCGLPAEKVIRPKCWYNPKWL